MTSILGPLKAKIWRELRGYKANFITMACLVVKIKASLDSVPIYWLNLFLKPQETVREIDNWRKKFLWGSKQGRSDEK